MTDAARYSAHIAAHPALEIANCPSAAGLVEELAPVISVLTDSDSRESTVEHGGVVPGAADPSIHHGSCRVVALRDIFTASIRPPVGGLARTIEDRAR